MQRPEQPGTCEDDAFEEELAQALQQFEQRGADGLDEFLRSRPERAQKLRQRIERLRKAGVLAPPVSWAGPIDDIAKFGEFRVIRKLATGGMGVVYLAEQTSLQREVALKVVRPEFLGSEVARERFQREVEAVARLSHPGIVPILAVGLEGTVPWFAMEFLDGVTLDKVIKSMGERDVARTSAAVLREVLTASGEPQRGSASAGTSVFAGTYQESCVRLVLQVAQAMSHVHARGIVHRDLKPSNIMLTSHGQALVLDFGLAHVQDMQRLTQQLLPIGSPAYMAPEQLLGEAIDERVDVYGLGVTLYELLTASLPFDASSQERLRQLVLAGTCAPVDRVNRGVSRDLAVVVAVAMDRDRGRRYSSMADLAEDLERVLARQPIRARPLSLPLRGWRLCQRHPAWAVTTAGLLFLLLQFPLVLWWLQAEANVQLSASNDRLQAAQAQEASAKQLATLSFEDAYLAIYQMLDRIGRYDLVSTPGSERLRIEWLGRALKLYERLIERRPDDRRVVIDASRTQQELGALYSEIGDWRAAERCYEQVLERLAEVGDAKAAGLRGITGKLWGQSLMGRGKLVAAEEVLQQADCEMRFAVAQIPSSRNRLQAAEVLNTWASVCERGGRIDEWQQLLEQAQAKKQAVWAEAPHEFDAAKALAIGCSNLARCLGRRKQREQALVLLGRGIEALLGCQPRDIDGPPFRRQLAALYDRRGNLLNESGQQVAAEEAYGHALALRLELHQEFPNTAAYASYVGATCHNLAMTHIARRQYEQALDFDEHSVQHQRRALRIAPHNRPYARFLEYALVTRCVALLSLQRLDELDVATGELAADAVTAEGLLNAARLRAHHAGLSKQAQQSDKATRMRDQAAALVSQAVDLGWSNRAHFEKGRFAKLYGTLRGHPVYDAALQRL